MTQLDPIESFIPADSITLGRGDTIRTAGEASGAGLASFGDNSSLITERGSLIQSRDDFAFGIFSVGAGSSVAHAGRIVQTGDSATGLFLGNGDATISGSIRSSGDATFDDDGFSSAIGALNVGEGTLSILKGGTIFTRGDGSLGAATFGPGSVENAGMIIGTGDDNVGMIAAFGDLTNDGIILQFGAGSQGMATFSGTLVNNGQILVRGSEEAGNAAFGDGSAAIDVFAPGASVINNGLAVSRQDAALEVSIGENPSAPVPDDGGIVSILNSATGVLRGTLGIDGSVISEHVVNAGLIEGDVRLGGGDDRYQALGAGRVVGTIDGGDGNDQLTGGSADETFTLGAGADTLVFTGGHDTVTDFNPDEDLLILDGLNGDNATLTRVGNDLLIRFDDETSLTLSGLGDVDNLADLLA